MGEIDKQPVAGLLNHILEQELAGVVRYPHYFTAFAPEVLK